MLIAFDLTTRSNENVVTAWVKVIVHHPLPCGDGCQLRNRVWISIFSAGKYPHFKAGRYASGQNRGGKYRMTVFPLWGGRRNPAAFFAFQGACRGDWRLRRVNVQLVTSLFAVFGDDGFPFNAKIRTILVNFPKGFLWYGISIGFGMHDLTICIYHQLVMTYFSSLFLLF